MAEIGFPITVTVPAEYVTDFASVPLLFRWPIPTSRKVSRTALLHGQPCRLGDERATIASARAMKLAGVSFWRRWPMVAFVAVFGFPELYLLGDRKRGVSVKMSEFP